MTAMARRYGCKHCPESFSNAVTLGGHVHAKHPDHRRALPKFLRESAVASRARSALKRPTDTWPGKP